MGERSKIENIERWKIEGIYYEIRNSLAGIPDLPLELRNTIAQANELVIKTTPQRFSIEITRGTITNKIVVDNETNESSATQSIINQEPQSESDALTTLHQALYDVVRSAHFLGGKLKVEYEPPVQETPEKSG